MKRMLFVICLAALCAEARILLVVDNSYYNYGPQYKASIDRYIDDIVKVDRKPCELILWTTGTGTVRNVCYPLWQKLVSEYSIHHHVPATDDDVEGAIFIGALPIPQFRHWEDKEITRSDGTKYTDTTFWDLPHDGYFMDVWNQNTNSAYNSDLSMWPWYSKSNPDVFRGKAYNQFFNFYEGTGSGYNCDSTGRLGDGIPDIWVSRIMGEFVKIPQGSGFKNSNDIILEYMNRAHARMTQPATVPARSFSMSGISDFGSPYPDNALHLDVLGLPFHAVFQNPNNNPANLQGQLQAGPLGNINYGGYYLKASGEGCSLYQNTINYWSERFCTWSSMLNRATNSTVYNLDNKGYEWAGLYEHGSADGLGMNGVHASSNGGFRAMNGHFSNYMCALPVCDYGPTGKRFSYYDADAINSNYMMFCHGDLWINQDPNVEEGYPWKYGPEWTGANAMWKFSTPTVSGNYDIYVHYIADQAYNSKVNYKVEQFPINKDGALLLIGQKTIDQRIHIDEQVPGNRWERIGRFSFNNSATYDTTYVKLEANGNDDGIRDASGNLLRDQYGNLLKGKPFFIDAIKIVGVAGTPTQNFNKTVDNNGSDFSLNPRGDRSYLEFPIDGGPSKVQFFLTNSCHLCHYNATSGSAYNNLGNLFAMLYNGLISMGTVTVNYAGGSYFNFVQALKNGDDFGQAYLKQSSSLLYGDPQFILLGAGNLKAAAYIPYGAQIVSDVTINSAVNKTYQTPVYLKNYNVTPSGSLNFNAKSEIHIVPESAFRAGSNVHFYVQ